MSILILSDEAQASIHSGLQASQTQEQVDDLIRHNPAVSALLYSAKKIIHQEKYVQIKGLPILNELGWQSFVGYFGEYYGAIERTDIKTDCNYTGCSLNPLVLHNDDAVDLTHQPKYGFIQVTQTDALGIVANGIVLVRELKRKLQFEDPQLLRKLLSHPIPMLSYGINYDDKLKNEIITNEPIIYKSETGEYCVRFDQERNAYFYQMQGIEQSPDEALMIYEFLRHANQIKKKLFLSEGDILIHDNQCTLHDREGCSIKFNLDGTTYTRSIAVSFARYI
ncbi:TauD/TfdA family dioxygenase [Vibrio sp. MEBiC08052]|uniref:TauD/TfdA family dioxygenase n=1 Tax=Vibrio sp. MEBiC08052 TaxID=1761910 RepID=UPI000740681C|nr:TauD/TfdA family dioxygenase [Vibrio sp. MEBiC08052]KUI99470.1 hypothetical protein VRK_15540 [Vibrio sp. MEBiC08052]